MGGVVGDVMDGVVGGVDRVGGCVVYGGVVDGDGMGGGEVIGRSVGS